MSQVLIVGKPNSGKSLLFNRLTGLQQKVANFAGVTVEVKTGQAGGVEFQDFPGLYSFNPITRDEQVAVEKFDEALESSEVRAILCTLDVTRLERSLILGLQVLERARSAKKPIVFALNMMDELKSQNLKVDIEGLSEALGSPLLPISARTQEGMIGLECRLESVLKSPEKYLTTSEAVGEKALDYLMRARELAKKFGPQTDVILTKQNRLDGFFLSNWLGGISFVLIMAFLFQSIFTWAAPLMDFVEETISWLGAEVGTLLPEGIATDFVEQAIFGGVGSFLVFVPQIFVLIFIIGLLEDSGYLARAAIICHRPLRLFGLSGRSFIPLLSGHACAIPAIFATRMIESPKKRILTLLAVPLMACSARLPVYALLIAALVPPMTYFGGLIGLQGLIFFAVFAFGIFVALIVSGLLSRTVYKTESDTPFVVELPPYRMPHWKPLIKRSLAASWAFVSKAGVVIFSVTLVVWVLGYFPSGSGHLQESYLAKIGQFLEPAFEPLGLTWQYGVAILASFLAREVFVGTLGTLFGIEGADENIAGLSEHIQNSGFSVASAIALLVFYAIALQCVSTVAVMKKETGSWKLPLLTFFAYGLLAYGLGWVAYQMASSLV